MNSEQYLFSIVDEIQRREAQHGFDRLSKREQVFAAVWSLEADVNNGGFHQYFFNSAGDNARAALDGLRTIGASSTATILASAMALFGSNGPAADQEIRQQQLEALLSADAHCFATFDANFYKYPNNLSSLLTAYMHNSMA